jgi:hypothetical protein
MLGSYLAGTVDESPWRVGEHRFEPLISDPRPELHSESLIAFTFRSKVIIS